MDCRVIFFLRGLPFWWWG